MPATDIYGYDLTEETTGKVLKVRYGEAVAPAPVADPGSSGTASQVLAQNGTYQVPSVSFASNSDSGLWNPGDGIGVTVDSNEVARFRSNELQIDVPVTGTAVQSNATDSVAGRLLRNGSWGLGGPAPFVNGGTQGGIFSYNVAAGHTGLPDAIRQAVVYQGSLLNTTDWTTQVVVVIAATEGSAYQSGQTLSRARRDGVWTELSAGARRVLTADTVAVTTTRRMVRDYATGIQEIWLTNVETGNIPTEVNAWQAPFLETPSVQVTVRGPTYYLAQATATNTMFELHAALPNGTGTNNARVDIYAAGRFV